MKGMVKVIIAGVIIIAIGAAVLITALALSGWNLKGVEFETQTFTAENENTALKVEISAGTLVTQYYDGDKVVIEYPVANNFNAEITERGGCVYYKTKIKWHASWFIKNYPQTVIKLPANTAFKVDIDMSAGTVELADGKYSDIIIDMSAGTFKAGAVECNKFDCDLSAGTVKVDKIAVNTTKIDVSAGTAKLGFTGEQSEYGVTAKVSAGTCNVSTHQGSTFKTIDVHVSAGTVNLSFNV